MTLRRPKQPGARRHLDRTPAQETAFRVFRLRGLYWMAYALTGTRRGLTLEMIDSELQMLGAESETDRHARRTRELNERLEAAEAADRALDKDIPW